MNPILVMAWAYSFLIGICLASFINVVIDRLPRHDTFVRGRSHCDNCGIQLKAYDLIPLVSYLVLKGKCRNCGNEIGARSFWIELLGGILAIVCFNAFGFTWMSLLAIAVYNVLLAITFIDFDTLEIPNGLNIAMLVLGIIGALINPDITLINRLIGMVAVSIPLLVMALAIPGSFGGGDVKLMVGAGLLLGWQNCLLATFIGIITAGIYGIILLLSHKNELKDHIAFGPYLSLGIFIALIWGNQIISWYLALFI